MTMILKLPYGELGIIALKSCIDLGDKVNEHLKQRRKESFLKNKSPYFLDKERDSYLVSCNNVRFSNGEGKATLAETVRGKDIYILADIGNHGCMYELYGRKKYMGPDEHYQDIKRTISAIAGNARRISVIMPFLYAGRQHKRKERESLDCAVALQELERLGVKNIITFDAHDPRVQNAIPLTGFESIHATYEMIEALLCNESELVLDNSHMIVISPDTGAMDRALYYAGILGIDIGVFYKRRDFTRVIKGKNPIISHQYMGGNLAGKDVLVVDDMIASGESIFNIANQLKKRNARNIYVAVTFALFTEGVRKFKESYEQGLIKRFYATNLTYVPEDIKKTEWFKEVDMSYLMAEIIDKLNYDESISSLFDSTERISAIMEKKKL